MGGGPTPGVADLGQWVAASTNVVVPWNPSGTDFHPATFLAIEDG